MARAVSCFSVKAEYCRLVVGSPCMSDIRSYLLNHRLHAEIYHNATAFSIVVRQVIDH